MAHNLSIQDGKVEMFSGENIVPWHRLGTIVEGLATSAEAIQHAHMDWTVELKPVFCENKEVERYFAVARNDNKDVLSIVGERYHPIQNIEAFEFFDEVIATKEAVYTTAGALGKGERVWIMAKINSQMFINSRPDDKQDKLILLTSSHDGSGSLSMQMVSVRVVCQNTLSMALSGKANTINIRHTKNYKNKVFEAQKILKFVHAYYDDLQGVLNELDKMPMSNSDANSFLEKLIPDNEDSKFNTRTEGIRDDILTLFRKGKGNEGRTRYDMLNGVTDYVDHTRVVRVQGSASRQEARMVSALMGSGQNLKQRATAMLVA